MPDQATEPWHAVKCRLGSVEFWNQSRVHQQPRRIQRIDRPGQVGSETRDMGASAKGVNISAILTRSQVDEIELFQAAAVPVRYRDPVGTFYDVRIENTVPTASTEMINWFQTQITLVKADLETEPAQLRPTQTPKAAAAAARTDWDAFYATFGVASATAYPGESIPATPASLVVMIGDVTDAWDDFDSLLTLQLDEGTAATVGAMARAFDIVAAAVDSTVEAAELFVDSVLDMPGEMVDDLLSMAPRAETLKASGLGSVAAFIDAGDQWASVLLGGPQDIMSLLLARWGELPADIDDQIDRILTANLDRYGPLDPLALPGGLELEIPRLAA